MPRRLEIPLALLCLCLATPALLLAAAWIKLSSPGPVFFRQQRVGRDERPFRIWKLRTMRVAAPGGAGPSVSIQNDPRIIRGGRVLRQLKIDELPQLINVLAGQMSLVGPRPTVWEDHDRMTPRQRARSRVRPGMTGLAQVRGGAAVTWPKRIELDLRYISQRSTLLDLSIMIETAALVLSSRANEMPVTHDEWSEAA